MTFSYRRYMDQVDMMSAIDLTALIVLVIFYTSFFIKMRLLKRQGINGNLLGKGEKPERARLIEKISKAITYG